MLWRSCAGLPSERSRIDAGAPSPHFFIATCVALASLPASAQATITRGWAPAGAMSAKRALHAAVTLDNGTVLVVGGGIDAFANGTRGADLYDPATNTWSPAGALRLPRSGLVLIKLRDGRVLAAGGWDDARRPRAEAELY